MLSLKLVGVAALISTAVASDVADRGQVASPRIIKRHRHRQHHHHDRYQNGLSQNEEESQNFFNWGPWGQTEGGNNAPPGGQTQGNGGGFHPPGATITRTVTVTACGPGGGSSIAPPPTSIPSHPISSHGPPPSSYAPPPVSTHPHPSSATGPPHISSAASTGKPGPSTKPAGTTSSKPTPTGGSGRGGGAVVGSNGLVNITVGGGVSDPQAWVDAHNAYRRMYHAPDVKWSDTVAASAQEHSDSCKWGHFQGAGDHYGQASPPRNRARNLAAGQPDIVHVLGDWVNGASEKGKFDPADNGSNVYSHFTQVVWADTTEIGCAVKKCSSMSGLSFSNADYWTCEYNPPGNMIGDFKNNVHALKGGAPS